MEQNVVCSFGFLLEIFSENWCITEEVLLRTRVFLKRRKRPDRHHYPCELMLWAEQLQNAYIHMYLWP